MQHNRGFSHQYQHSVDELLYQEMRNISPSTLHSPYETSRTSLFCLSSLRTVQKQPYYTQFFCGFQYWSGVVPASLGNTDPQWRNLLWVQQQRQTNRSVPFIVRVSHQGLQKVFVSFLRLVWLLGDQNRLYNVFNSSFFNYASIVE